MQELMMYKKPKKGHTGPLSDTACTEDFSVIIAVTFSRSEDNDTINSV